MINSPGNIIYYYLNDHIGTPRKLMDQNGDIVWSVQYTPFGEATVEAGSTVENNFRFRGQYYDSETGLHYNYHRYYSTIIGRYLRADPIGQNGGLNLYTYAANDPVDGVDPYGLAACPPGTIHVLDSECFHHCVFDANKGMFECADECATCMEKEPASGWSTGYSRGYSSAGGEAGTIKSISRSVTPIGKNNWVIGGTFSYLTKDYSFSTEGKGEGRSSSLLGASVDLTFGKKGLAEIGIGARNFGLWLELEQGGIKGVTFHFGVSLPPTFGYGSVPTE